MLLNVGITLPYTHKSGNSAHPHVVINLYGRLLSASHRDRLVNLWYVSHKKESYTVLVPMNPILLSLYLLARPSPYIHTRLRLLVQTE